MMRRTARRFVCCTVFLTCIMIVLIIYRDDPAKDRSIQIKWLVPENKVFGIKGDDVVKERLKRVRATCERIGSVSNRISEVSRIKSINMSYCVVQKAGCTMWIRIIKFKTGQNNRTGNPMTISKFETHYTQSEFYRTLKQGSIDWYFIAKSLRIMTVRDPYTRLWSAYIDKFVLPDFWITKGRQIVRMMRKNPDKVSLTCGHDVTFPEFIQYVITIGHSFTYINQDKHWLPASDLCDPCVFKPHITGKQETFIADFKYSLKQLKLEDLILQLDSVDDTEFEIKDEIDYNVKIFPKVKHCIGKLDLFKRMWQAFTLNGYLPSSKVFPTVNFSDSLNAGQFFKIIQQIRQKFNITNQKKNERRKDTLIRAFKELKREQVHRLRSLYKMDFSLFDYESDQQYLNPD